MKVITNIEKTDLVRSFNGNDYIFPSQKPIQVEDDLVEHLKETLPLAFDFEPELKKDSVVAKVHKTPTKSVFPGAKFGVQSANLTKEPVDGLPANDEFVGPGLENDTL